MASGGRWKTGLLALVGMLTASLALAQSPSALAPNRVDITAYEAVAKVWSPDDAWKTLMRTLLRKNGVNFEPY